MRTPSQARLLVPGLVAAVLLIGCGKKSSSSPSSNPTGPSPAGTEVSRSYAGKVSLSGGVTGLLTVTTTMRSGLTARVNPLRAVFDIIEPRLLAQGGSATGALALSDGTAVTLSGTYNAGSFQLSGDGGYSVSASVSGGALSGTLSTPGGSANLQPVFAPAPSGPAPTNPAGVYAGTFSVVAHGFFTNRVISTGFMDRNCGYEVTISGTLTIRVEQADAQVPGNWWMQYAEQLREINRPLQPCPDVPVGYEENVGTDPNSKPGESSSSLDNIQIALANTYTVPGVDGTGFETSTFIGALGGSTIQGVYIKSRRHVGRANPNNEHRQGYPPTEVSVTLQKQ